MLALMPVAIAINIAVGAIIVALRLPIYLDSIGTVLVGVLAGPWAGALTGLLVEPDLVAAARPGRRRTDDRVLRAGRRRDRPDGRLLGSRGVFRLRADDARVGGFLALAPASAAAGDRAARGPADDRPRRSTSSDPDSQTPLRDARR